MKIIIHRLLFVIKNRSIKVRREFHVSYKTKVGRNCRLGNFCRLTKDVVLGDNVIVGDYSDLNKISVGKDTMLESGIKMPGTGKGRVIIGKECYIGINNILDTSDNIIVGDFVHIAGPSTSLWCHTSAPMCMNSIPLRDPDRDKYRPTLPITIEDNVYIGGNCTIYPGVKIGHHAIVAPNSAVNKNVEPYTMVGGVPAILIKDYELGNYQNGR
jgi:acetyltransferase-like isoleucine patch superfamily enzyme